MRYTHPGFTSPYEGPAPITLYDAAGAVLTTMTAEAFRAARQTVACARHGVLRCVRCQPSNRGASKYIHMMDGASSADRTARARRAGLARWARRKDASA